MIIAIQFSCSTNIIISTKLHFLSFPFPAFTVVHFKPPRRWQLVHWRWIVQEEMSKLFSWRIPHWQNSRWSNPSVGRGPWPTEEFDRRLFWQYRLLQRKQFEHLLEQSRAKVQDVIFCEGPKRTTAKSRKGERQEQRSWHDNTWRTIQPHNNKTQSHTNV